MANGLPTTRDQASILGASAIPTGRVQPPPIDLDVPDVSRVAPIDISLPDFNASPELLSFATPEPSARAAQPRIDFDAPTPLTAEETIEFEPEALSARAQLVEGLSPEFEGLQVDVADLSRQEADLFRRGDEIAFSLGTEKRPKKRAEFEQEAEDNLAARAAIQQKLGLTRGLRDREQAKQTARIGDAIAGQERRTVLDIEETRLSMEREGQLDDEARAEAGRQAEQELRGAKERHAQIIERGPARPAFATTAIAMFTEALKPLARPDGTADFGGVVDRLMRDSEAQWSREVEAAKLRTQIEGDDIGNIGRARKEELLQRSVIRELTARELQLETDKLVAGAQDDFSRARAVTISDELKRIQAEENAKQQALAQDRQRKAALDAQKFRKGEAEIELTRAKTGTEAAKQQQALAKLGGAKSGAGGVSRASKKEAIINATVRAELRDLAKLNKKEAQRVEDTGLFNPFTGRILKRGDGSFATIKDPKGLRSQIAATTKANRLIEQIVATRAESGAELSIGSFLKSTAGQKMKSDAAELLATLNKSMGLGSLDAGSQDILERMAGGDPTAWADPTPGLRNAQRNALNGLQSDLAAQAGFDGRLALPTTTAGPPRRTLETTRRETRDAFDPDTGNILPSKKRFLSFQESTAKLEVQRGGLFAGRVAAASEARRLIGDSEIPSLLDAEHATIQQLLDDAIDEGDPGATKTLRKSLTENRRFKRRMQKEITRLRRLITGEAKQKDKEVEGLAKAASITGVDPRKQKDKEVEGLAKAALLTGIDPPVQ